MDSLLGDAFIDRERIQSWIKLMCDFAFQTLKIGVPCLNLTLYVYAEKRPYEHVLVNHHSYHETWRHGITECIDRLVSMAKLG